MGDSKFTFQTTLIIDDNEIDVLVNRRLITLTNFSENVIISSTAEEALDFLKRECTSAKHAPDWILLDMHLPGMDGYDFVEEFKKLPSYIQDKTKLLILSAFQKQEKLEKVLLNKFVFGQCEKPLTRESLNVLTTNKYVYTNEEHHID
jgi:CheY-like chemotaxis protein